MCLHSFCPLSIPVASHSCCLVRCLLLPFGRIYSHAMSPRNLPRLPLPLCTLCQPVAALQQLRRIAASGFVATKAFVANNFTSLTRSPSLSLSTALLQLECVLSANTMRKRERAKDTFVQKILWQLSARLACATPCTHSRQANELLHKFQHNQI